MENYIKKTEFAKMGEKTTICLLTLHNGFEVHGKSACVNPNDFDKELGEKYAREDAMKNFGEFLGFYLQVVRDGYPYKTE